MTALMFLAIPVVIITIGCCVLWLRARNPNTLESGIDSFRREMRALSPEEERRARRSGGGSVGRR